MAREWRPGTRDIEGEVNIIFQKLSIIEIRNYEQRTKRDIEKKKQELRTMVGERYRELIEAADSITKMKDSALQIQNLFGDIKTSCNSEFLISNFEVTRPHESQESKDSKNRIYRIAGQIKLLVDTPEQIWHALEGSHFLLACRLFLIARQIFNNLQSKNEKDSVKVLQQFPLIQRQWDAISHFRTQILEGGKNHLKKSDLTNESLVETLSAIILLQRITPLEGFEEFLKIRKISIESLLAGYQSSAVSISTHISSVIQLLQTTICHVNNVFLVNDGTSILDICLQNLHKNFSGLTLPSNKNEYSISGLYNSKTNVHLVSRYLPDTVQRFTPYINFGEPNQKANFQTEIKNKTRDWLQKIIENIKTKTFEMLQLIEKAQNLSSTRNVVWKTLGISELGEPLDEKHPESFAFQKACLNVLGEEFCLWKRAFRDVFFQKSSLIIEKSFTNLTTQSSTYLIPLLNNLEKSDSLSKESNIGQFVWTIEETRNMSFTISNRVFGFTGTIITFLEGFDRELQFIKDDLSSLFIQTSSKGKDADLNFVLSDSLALRNILQTTFEKEILHYTIELQNNLRNIEESSTNQEVGINKMLFIGRIARSIVTQSKNLPLVSELSQIQKDGKTKISSMHQNSKIHRTESTVLEKLHDAFNNIYISSHTLWLNWLAKNVSDKIQKPLISYPWNETGKRTIVWESLSFDEETANTQNTDSFKLPSQVSKFILDSLFFVTSETHKKCGHTLDKGVVRLLIIELTEKLFTVYSNFTQQDFTVEKISEKGAIQILFDFQFLVRLLKGGWDGNKLEEYQNRAMGILSKIKELIDPIDLAILETHLGKNVERFYARNCLLLGVFTSHNETPVDLSKRTSKNEQHNTIALSPQAKRFLFLPIVDNSPLPTQKMSFEPSLGEGKLNTHKKITKAPIAINLSTTSIKSVKSQEHLANFQKGTFFRVTGNLLSGLNVFGAQDFTPSP